MSKDHNNTRNTRRTHFTRFFSGIIGDFLGVKRSSRSLVGDVDPSQPLGQARIETMFNAANGNLFIKDHSVPIEALGFHFDVGMVYNSQSDQDNSAWRFNLTKKISGMSPQANATITEEDGDITTFQYDPSQNLYIATGLAEGISTLRQNPDDTLTLYCVGTGMTTQFSTTGLQTSLTDRFGRTCNFKYDGNNQLEKIELPENHVIFFTRAANKITVSYQEGDKPAQTLMEYTFDGQQRLSTTSIPVSKDKTYNVNYQYDDAGDNASGYVKSVQQTDGTILSFTYQGDGTGAYTVTGIQAGDDPAYTIQYEDQDAETQLIDPLGRTAAEYHFHNDASTADSEPFLDHIVHLVSGTVQDTLDFTYDKGLLKQKTYSSGVIEKFDYDANQLLQTTEDILEHQITIFHDLKTGLPISHISYAKKNDATTALIYRFIYNEKQQLVGEITPEGFVTQYTYDDKGNRISSRGYINVHFDASGYQSDQAIPLADFTAWCSAQNIIQTRLVDFGFNDRGQVISEKHYVNLDAQGNGIFDEKARFITKDWDAFGDRLSESQRQSTQVTSTNQYQYDGLQRLTLHTDPMQQQTQSSYEDEKQSVVTSLPTGLTRTVVSNKSGLPVSKQESAEGVTRISTYARNEMGFVYEIQQPDQQKKHLLHDQKGRIRYEIDPLNYVTEYVHDDQDHLIDTIQYVVPIDASKIDWKTIKTEEFAAYITVTPDKDRHTSQIYDLANRLCYTVDGENGVIKQQHDDANRHTVTTRYANTLAQDTVRNITNLDQFAANDDPKKRVHHFYRDKDSHIVGEQDAAGFVTENMGNSAGDVNKKIRYATATVIADTLDAARPAEDKAKDAHYLYFRDLLGQSVYEVDPESYLTECERLSNGFTSKKTQYAKQLDLSAVHSISDIHVVTDAEDQVSSYEYDAANRSTAVTQLTIGVKTSTAYNAANDVVYSAVADTTDATQIRETYTRFNAWSQKAAEMDPRASAVYRKIDQDPLTPPDQKKILLEQVWTNSASHSNYDSSGLCLTTTDQLQNKTIYYYTASRQLKYTIDPKGFVKENIYGEDRKKPEKVRAYAKALTTEQLQSLTGGIVTDTVSQLVSSLADDQNDSIEIFTYDRRGLTTSITDPENYKTVNTFNAFKECERQSQTVDAQHQLMTTFNHEPRGYQTTVVQDKGGLEITTSQSFDSHGKVDTLVDPNGNKHTFVNNRRGQQVSHTDSNQQTETQQWDAFSRLTEKTDRLKRKTKHGYQTAKRTHTITTPEGRSVEIQQNAFGEKITETDANKKPRQWEYEPGGQVSATMDELQRRIEDGYDLVGFHSTHRNAKQVASKYEADATAHLTAITDDSDKLKFTTKITQRDFHHLETERVNSRQIKKTTARDRRGLEKKTVLDPKDEKENPDGLHIIEDSAFNGLKKKTSLTKGNIDNPDQYQEQYLHDTAGRSLGKVIDPKSDAHPDGLALTTSWTLDKTGNQTTSTDPNGNITFHFHNSNNKEICTVDPTGLVTAITRDAEDQILEIRHYAQLLTPAQLKNITPSTVVSDIYKLLNQSDQDQVVLSRYDLDGKLKYRIDYAGAVTEYLYDDAGRRIGNTRYFAPIQLSQIKDITAAEIANLIVKTSGKDRTSYQILDAAGQLRFEVDAMGYVKENRYDDNRNPTAQISYANAIDLSKIKLFTPDEITGLLVKPEECIAQYDIYDRLDRRVLHIDGGKFVTQYQYDEDDNEVQCRRYVNPLSKIPDVLDEASVLALLQKDDQNDRIIYTTVDALSRKKSVKDVLGYEDLYKYSIFGITSHTDKAKNEWEYEFDRAGREFLQRSPLVHVVQVVQDTASLTFKLTTVESDVRIEKRTAHDNNGNSLTITEGDNLPDSRSLKMGYSAKNKMIQSTQESVLVDDPTKTPTETLRPDSTKTLNRNIVFDSFQRPMVTEDESGACEFTVYNPAGKILYTVDAEGYVISYQRNIFQEEETVTAYAKKLTIDLTQYKNTGLTAGIIQQALVLTPGEDRTIAIDHDLNGRKTETTFKGEVHVLTMQDGQKRYTKAELKTRWVNDAYGDATVEKVLVDPTTDTWAETHTFFNYDHEILATVDPEGYVTICTRNCDDNVEDEVQYANSIFPNAIPTTVADLKAICESNSSSKDRHKRYEYDQKGRPHKEIVVGAIVQKGQVDEKGTSLVDQPPKDLIRQTDYDPRDNQSQVREANGAIHRFEHDAYGREATTRSPARKTKDSQGEPITYIEVVQKGFTAYGEAVKKVRDVEVPVEHSGVILVDDLHEMRQTTLTLVESRGLPIAVQEDQDENSVILRFLSYTATKKQARKWQWVSGWSDQPVPQPASPESSSFLSFFSRFFSNSAQDAKADYQLITWLYQLQTSYNLRQEKVETRQRQRDGSDVVTQQRINAFNEVTGIGPGDGTWPVENRFDTVGRPWYSTQYKGIPTIYFYDGTNKDEDTASFRPGGRDTAVDIRSLTYEDSANLLTMDYTQVAQAFTQRDLKGNVRRQDLPQFKAIKQGAPEPIHTTFLVGKKFPNDFGVVSISWPEAASKFLVGKMRLWVKGHEDVQPIELDVVRKNGRMGVDVTQLTTDYYTYELTYYSIDALTNTVNYEMPVYRVRATDLPVDTGNTAQSEYTVIEKTGPATLAVAGKTQNVAGIALIKDGQVKSKVAASALNGEYELDLSQEISGTYTAKFIRSTDNIDGPVPLGATTASGYTVSVHTTTFRANSTAGDKSMGDTIAWSDLPSFCTQLQGRFASFDVTQLNMPNSYSATIRPHQPELVEDFKADSSSGSHQFNYKNSGQYNFPGLKMQIFALDSDGHPFYLGQATDSVFTDAVTPLPYLYVVSTHEMKADVVVLSDTNGVYAVLALEPWMNGMRRVCVSDIAIRPNTVCQLKSLSPVIDDTFETAPFEIQTSQASAEIQSRELLLEQSYCDAITPEYPYTYVKPTIKIADGRYANQYVHVIITAHQRTGNDVTKDLYLGEGIGSWALQTFPGPAAGVTHLRASIVLDSGAEIPLINAAPTSQSGTRYLFSGHVNYLSPIPANTASIELEYFDNTLGRDSAWRSFEDGYVTLVAGDGIAINSQALASGIYDFRLKAYDTNRDPIPLGNGHLNNNDGWYYGYLNINNSNGFIATPIQEVEYELLSPVVYQTPDRWDNVLSQQNARGFVTNKTFNHSNRVLTVDESEIDVTLEDGQEHPSVRTETRYGYNETDDPVGVVDANNHATVHDVNDSHAVVKTTLADGTYQEFIRDGYDRETAIVDALRHAKPKKYNKRDQVIRQADALGNATTWDYNERRDTLSTTNPEHENTRFDADSSHNTVRTIMPLGQVTRRVFDRNHEAINEDFGLAGYYPLTYKRHYFGHLLTYTDLSGALYTNSRDFGWRLTSVVQTGGNHGQYYDARGVLVDVPGKNIVYANNEAGYVEGIIDVNDSSTVSLHLNIDGTRIGERFFAFDGLEHQATFIELNSRDWPVKIWDIRIQARYSHDAYGNRRRTQVAYVWASDGKQIPNTQDSWYLYNPANVMTIVEGSLVDGQITIAKGHGTQLGYKDKTHLRETEIILDNQGRKSTKTIHYQENDLVSDIHTEQGDGTITDEEMKYDGAARRREYTKSSSSHPDSTDLNFTEKTGYDKNGGLDNQTHDDKSISSVTQFTQKDNQGNSTHQQTVTNVKDSQGDVVVVITDDYDQTYLGFDQLQLMRSKGQRDTYQNDRHVKSPIQSIFRTFNSNGGVRSIEGDSGPQGGRAFVQNSEGVIVYAQASKIFDTHQPAAYGLDREYDLPDTNGHILGYVGNIPEGVNRTLTAQDPSSINFDLNYRAITESYPPPCPGTYVPVAGDTFFIIAGKMGDSSKASDIAEANRLNVNDPPPIGQQLTIPQSVYVSVHNWEGIYPVYDDTRLMGSSYPYLPAVQIQPPKNKTNFLELFLEVFVEVLILYFQPQLAGIFGGLLKSWQITGFINLFASNAMAGAILGGGVDVLQQLTAMGFGDQKEFSANHLLTAMLNQAELAGVGGALKINPNEFRNSLDFFKTVGKTAGLVTITQLLRMATGQQKNLSWQDMVATLSINGSNVGINRMLVGLAEGPAKDFALSVLRVGITQAVDGIVYRQQFSIQVYAASVLGTFAGTMAAQSLTSKIDEHEKLKAEKAQQEQAKKAYAALLQMRSDLYAKMMFPDADESYRGKQYQALLTGDLSALDSDPSDSNSSSDSRLSQNSAAMFSRKPLQTTNTKSIAYQQRQTQHAAVDAQAQNQASWNAAGSKALAANSRGFNNAFDEILHDPVTSITSTIESAERTVAPALIEAADALRGQAMLMNRAWLQFTAQWGIGLQANETTLDVIRQGQMTQATQMLQQAGYMERAGRGMELMGHFIIPAEIALGAIETGVALHAASPADQEYILYRQIGKVGSSIAGGSIGGFIGSLAGGFVGGVAGGALGAAMGASIGDKVMQQAYQYHQLIDPAIASGALSFFPPSVQPLIEQGSFLRERDFMSNPGNFR